ncbi:TolB family protein [Pontibacter locisalis]|uniref:TolB family protein n=1 Tax=Pontibacter locisalis TaxID=1719035 RepID=A0ABW5IIW1_9BACT
MRKIYSVIAVAGLFLSSCASMLNQAIPDNAPGVTGNARELVRLTNDPIVEYYPRISPDGKKMLFYTVDNNKVGNERFSLVYTVLGQPGRTPLIGSHTYSGSWMKDSKSILYTYMRPSKPVICKGNIDGSSGISYISPSAMGEWDSWPTLSPDGKRIIFSSKVGNSYQICMMDLNGNNFTVLTEGTYPNFHPSGNSFLYEKAVGKFSQIFSYDMKTGQSTQLTSGEFTSKDASFSPDGKLITFTSTRDSQSSHIFVMEANGSNLIQITQGNSINYFPSFGSNKNIYFCSNAGAPKGNSLMASEVSFADIWTVQLLN